jgi:hypothetical protein
MVHFQNKESQFGHTLQGLAMENVGMFFDHLEYFMAVWLMTSRGFELRFAAAELTHIRLS